MFNDKNKNDVKIETLIGEKCNIIGSLNGIGVLRVDGYIEGDIYWDEDVILGKTCTCKGNITCIDGCISGNVIGNVTCKGTLIIESTGEIHGDILVDKLVMKKGAILDGKCTMSIIETSEDNTENQTSQFIDTY